MIEITNKLIKEYSIYPPNPNIHVKLLSGGNLMKVVVSRELEYATRALLAYNPTRGLDEATATFVRKKIKEKASRETRCLLYLLVKT